MTGPVQVSAPVVSARTTGAYTSLVLAAPAVAASARPGQFVALAVGGPESNMLLRRAFSLAGYGPDGTVEVVFAVQGNGTAWLAARRPGDPVDVVGPLGRPFHAPVAAGRCVLVGGGYGSGPMFPLAADLTAQGREVDLVLGAATADRLCGVDKAQELATARLTCTTEDGTAGSRGRVTDVLPALLPGAAAVYACGPMAMLAAVARTAADAGVPAQVAVEETMACGIGVCMTCVLPVRAADGMTRMVRSCVEGPVFAGHAVRWDALGSVPADAVGAAAMA